MVRCEAELLKEQQDIMKLKSQIEGLIEDKGRDERRFGQAESNRKKLESDVAAFKSDKQKLEDNLKQKLDELTKQKSDYATLEQLKQDIATKLSQ